MLCFGSMQWKVKSDPYSPLFTCQYLWQAVRFILEHRLLRYFWMPILINIFTYIIVLIVAIYEINTLIHWADHWIPSWLHWLNWLIWALFILAFIIVFIFSYTFLANLIAAPFNGLLAEKTEELLTGQPLARNNIFKASGYNIMQQLRLLIYFLPRAIACGILFLIPVVQIFAAAIWFLFNAWMMAMQYFSYPMENHLLPLREMRQILRKRLPVVYNFGTTIVLLNMVPFLSLVIMPIAVVAATMAWVDYYSDLRPKLPKP